MVGRRLALLGIARLAAACSFDSSATGPSVTIDAGADAGAPDAAVPGATHLLLTEVKSGPDPREFIEIFNPTCADVVLDDYYLSDDPGYPLLPSWGTPAPNPGSFDAVLRFPPGSVLASNTALVVARDGVEFAAAFGFGAAFSITNPADMTIVASGAMPDMAISNDGDPVVLFEWDGEADLVRDVDLVIAGDAPPEPRRLVAKQALAPDGIDGPDDGDATTAYESDAMSLPAMQVRDATIGSYQRVEGEGTSEEPAGGNGITGHDETSEDTTMTWEQVVDSEPTPGTVPSSLNAACGQ
jgi:hypothetical protein